jgi:hypothetical protein
VNAQEVKMTFQIYMYTAGGVEYALLRDSSNITSDMTLDPNQDSETYGPPLLDLHGPYMLVFDSDDLYTKACIVFKDSFVVDQYITLDDDRICNEIKGTETIDSDNRDWRQWELTSSAVNTYGSTSGTISSVGAPGSPGGGMVVPPGS